jgi:hypothetical protein
MVMETEKVMDLAMDSVAVPASQPVRVREDRKQ